MSLAFLEGLSGAETPRKPFSKIVLLPVGDFVFDEGEAMRVQSQYFDNPVRVSMSQQHLAWDSEDSAVYQTGIYSMLKWAADHWDAVYLADGVPFCSEAKDTAITAYKLVPENLRTRYLAIRHWRDLAAQRIQTTDSFLRTANAGEATKPFSEGNFRGDDGGMLADWAAYAVDSITDADAIAQGFPSVEAAANFEQNLAIAVDEFVRPGDPAEMRGYLRNLMIFNHCVNNIAIDNTNWQTLIRHLDLSAKFPYCEIQHLADVVRTPEIARELYRHGKDISTLNKLPDRFLYPYLPTQT